MTSSSSAQKDRKITFFLVSRKVSRKVWHAVFAVAVIAGTALQKLAFVVVVAVATLAKHHCVFLFKFQLSVP